MLQTVQPPPKLKKVTPEKPEGPESVHPSIVALSNALLTGGQCSEERARELATALVGHVNTMFDNFTGSKRALEQREKIRSLFIHIKDPKNEELRSRIIDERLSIPALANTAEIDLDSNSAERRALEQKLRAEASRLLFLRESDNPMIRKTHKGEEMICGSTDVEPINLPAYNMPQGPSNELVESPRITNSVNEENPPQEAPTESLMRQSATLNEEEAPRQDLEAKKEELGIAGALSIASPQVQRVAAPFASRPASKKASCWQGFIEKCPDDLPPVGVKAVQICGRNLGKTFGM